MMREYSPGPAPVGVVPRHRAGALGALLRETPETCTVADDLAPSQAPASTPLARWLSSAALVGLLAAGLEWLKLTR